MKVGVWYDSVEETLFNIDLPPNRPEGLQRGFLAYRADGKEAQVGGSANPVSILWVWGEARRAPPPPCAPGESRPT